MTTRTLTALAKGSAAFSVVLPLGLAAVIPGLRPAGLICSDEKPAEAVCEANAAAANDVADLSDALDRPGGPQLPGAPKAPQVPGAPGGPGTAQPPSPPHPGK